MIETQTPLETWLWLHELEADKLREKYGIEVVLGTTGWPDYLTNPDIFLKDAEPGMKEKFSTRLRLLFAAEGGPSEREEIQANLFEGRRPVDEWLFTVDNPVQYAK